MEMRFSSQYEDVIEDEEIEDETVVPR